MSTRLFARSVLLLKKPARSLTCSAGAVLTKSISSQETCIPLFGRPFSSPPDKESARHFSSQSNEEDSVEEDVEMKKMFEEWMSKFERSYSCPQEKEMRFKAFKENVIKINAHNKVEGRTYDQGVNMFVEWTSEDFENFNSGRRPPYHVERVPGKNRFAHFTSKDYENFHPRCIHTQEQFADLTSKDYENFHPRCIQTASE